MAVFRQFVDGKETRVSMRKNLLYRQPVFVIASLPGGMDVLSRKATAHSPVFGYSAPKLQDWKLLK